MCMYIHVRSMCVYVCVHICVHACSAIAHTHVWMSHVGIHRYTHIRVHTPMHKIRQYYHIQNHTQEDAQSYHTSMNARPHVIQTT